MLNIILQLFSTTIDFHIVSILNSQNITSIIFWQILSRLSKKSRSWQHFISLNWSWFQHPGLKKSQSQHKILVSLTFGLNEHLDLCNQTSSSNSKEEKCHNCIENTRTIEKIGFTYLAAKKCVLHNTLFLSPKFVSSSGWNMESLW